MVPTSSSILGLITTTFCNGVKGWNEKLLVVRPLEVVESLQVVVPILPLGCKVFCLHFNLVVELFQKLQ